jgi:mRNA-degrading endonuclease toxin of MazEF toxin-antitoxin module
MSKVKKERYDNRYLTISQGDVLLINFGKGSSGCRTRGVKPCVVVSNDRSIKTEGGFFVVPLYRNPSKAAGVKDILIRPVDCRGLRYEEYAGVLNMVLTVKCRVVRKIGHIENVMIVKEITSSFRKIVDDAG